MRLKSLLVILLLPSFVSAQGMFEQEVVSSKWRFNFGARKSTVKMNESPDFDYEYPAVYNYHLGMLRDFSLSKRWRARQGINFSQRAGLVTVDNGATDTELSIQARFVEFPVQLVRQITPRVFFYTGPLFGLRMTTVCRFSDDTWCSLANEVSFITPWQTGVEFPISDKFNLGIYYESGPGKYSNELSFESGIGVNFIFPATSVELTEAIE